MHIVERNDLSDSSQEILGNYEQFWGKRFELKAHPSEQVPLAIAIFYPEENEDDWVYATIGNSISPIITEKTHDFSEPFRSEIFILTQFRSDDLVDILFDLSVGIHVDKNYIDVGHTIKSERKISKNSTITDALFLKPSVIFDKRLNILHSKHYHSYLLWYLPIHRSEREYVIQHGIHKLIEQFAEQDTNTSNFLRKSVVG